MVAVDCIKGRRRDVMLYHMGRTPREHRHVTTLRKRRTRGRRVRTITPQLESEPSDILRRRRRLRDDPLARPTSKLKTVGQLIGALFLFPRSKALRFRHGVSTL